MLLLSFALTSCSDYDLKNGDDDPRGDGPRDSGDPPVTDTAEDTGEADSGGDTVPGDSAEDTGTPVDVPEGKIDVVLIVDVAYFYDCYHADVAMRASELVTALFATGADVAVAIASYDDYQVSGEWYAATGGLPYVLEQQLTTDQNALQAAAGGLALEWGGDGPGTGLEALAQIAHGNGYDQDCDGRFDASTDVRPFTASSGDAFGGGATGLQDTSTPGTGTGAGVGFRTGSKRVYAMFAENNLRDRDEGDEFPSGTCTAAQSRARVISALGDAKFLGVNVYEFSDIDPRLQEQLEDIAQSTGSRIDTDGDGNNDGVAVLSTEWDWPDTTTLVNAIFDLAEN